MISRHGMGRAPLQARTVTVALGIFLLLGVLVPNAILRQAVPPPYNETALHHTWDALLGRSVDDSWSVMQSAVDYLNAPGDQPVYSELYFNRGQRFQYPLSSLFALEGMLRVAGVDYVRTNKHAIYATLTINDALGWMFIALAFAATFTLLERSLKRTGFEGDTRLLAALRAAIVLTLTLTFYPIVKAYTLGQIQVWINGIFAVALLFWATGRSAASGFLIGIVTLIKPHFGLFLIWAILRRAWSFAASFAIIVAFGFGMSLMAYDLKHHLDYFHILALLSEKGELYFPNQSINGALNRLVALADPVTYNSLSFSSHPDYNIWVRSGTLIAAAIFLSTALFRREEGGEAARARDFCIMGLSLTMASPIAWEHHYGITFAMFAVLLTSCPGRAMGWLGASYVLIGTFLPVTNLLAATPWNIAQSALLIGALILLVLLHRQPANAFAAR